MASLSSKPETVPEPPSPFLDPAVAQRRQKRWFVALGTGSLAVAVGVMVWRPFGAGQDGVVAATIILAGLTGILAVVSNYQGERQGQMTWRIHAWEKQRTLEREARDEMAWRRDAERQERQALEEVLVEKYGSDYGPAILNDPPTLNQLEKLVYRADLECPRSDAMRRACSLNRSFWAATNRAVRSRAADQLGAMGLLEEADMEERAREAEIERYIDEAYDRSLDENDPEEEARLHDEHITQLKHEYMDGARARGWQPPSSPPGVIYAE